ncbi:cytochrome c3 family protein [Rosettibacter firmus]|uniref:cytochrome c3 family protein n=1 Tax=Rosettibacter firmus TaxID=3111522 RepID=UPI00336BF2F8
MKIKIFYAAIALSITIFLTIAAVNERVEPQKTNKNIIKFSHSLHKEIAECTTCHTKAAESISLKDRLLPEKDACATCHDVEDTDKCNTCHYEDVNEKLIQKESELIFNHKKHVIDQKMDCIVCHKGIEEVDYAFQSAAAFPKMNQCASCHNNQSVATNNCETCHISTVNLIPQDHQQVNFMKSHKFSANAENAECQMCHDNDFCETCHVSTTMITESNTAKDFYVPYSPHKFIDNTKQQQLSRVHDLNYRFTHGVDANNKSSECQTCHQVETFCAECHNSASGDFSMEGTMPASHRKSNFVTIGVGTGGGLHAELARRDIESCTSCHDIQGADPSCILCHVDNDGIKGTNPKTHIRSFMSDQDGDWHSDANSVCYTCHRDANARPNGIKGVGFCGYCHK